MSIEQEKEARARILALRKEENELQQSIDLKTSRFKEASFALTDLLERKRNIESELIGEDEAIKRINAFKKQIFDLSNDIIDLKEKKREVQSYLSTLEDTILKENDRLSVIRREYFKYLNGIDDKKAVHDEMESRIVVLGGDITKLEEKKNYFEKSNNDLNEHYKKKMQELDEREKKLDKRDKGIADAFSDLKVYESRIRREWDIILKDVSYKSPLEGLEKEES